MEGAQMHVSFSRSTFAYWLLLPLAALFTAQTAYSMPCPDADLDGFADCSVAGCDSSGLLCGDCDDTLGGVNPNAPELCNQVDDDCNGILDDGSPALPAFRSFIDVAGAADDELGTAVAFMGDVNGDGFGDLAAGRPEHDNDQGSNAGSVSLISGIDGQVLCRMIDPNGSNGDQLGSALAAVGDLTGDGIADLVAGTEFEDSGASNGGAALVFSGADCAFVRKVTDPDAQNLDRLGSSIAGLGDLNGDGFEDFAAGAPLDDTAGGNEAGSVTVFSGIDGSVLFKLTDPDGLNGDQLGIAVASAGDLNLDGTPDIAAGAYLDDTTTATNAGSVVIFSGTDGSVIDKWTDPAGELSDGFGIALAPITDRNNDGVPDLVVGSYRRNEGSSDTGLVLLLSGADGAVLERLIDIGRAPGDQLGYAVGSIRDLDGDGLAEVVASAYLDDNAAGADAGSLLVFSSIDGSVLHKLSDPAGSIGDRLGSAIALGDLDGDGVMELLAGSPFAEQPEGSNAGRALAISLTADCDLDGVTPFGGDCDDADVDRFSGNSEVCDLIDNDCDDLVDEDNDGDGFDACNDCAPENPQRFPGAPEICNGFDDDCNTAVDDGPDQDNDGQTAPCDCDDDDGAINDLAAEICDHIDNNCDGRIDESTVAFENSETLADTEGVAGDEYGSAVALIGDVNGDGVGEFAVGIPFDDPAAGTNAGSVLILSGADRSIHCRATDPQGTGGDRLGAAVAGIADLSGDGLPDLLAGAPFEDTTRANAGAVLLFSGADCSFVRKMADPASSQNGNLGHSVATLEDVTGDGIPDLIGGANLDDTAAGLDSGSATVFSGADGAVVYRLIDPQGRTGDQLGFALSGITDVDLDGVPDVVVGAYLDDTIGGSNAGSALIFSGADGRLLRKLVDLDSQIGDGVGYSVAAIDDLDGDGTGDILVGSYRDDHGAGSDAGSVLAFSGATGEAIRRFADGSGAAGDRAGSTVAPFPDMDGDGAPEVLAGAPLDNTPLGTDAGSLILFSGRTGAVLERLQGSGSPREMGNALAVLEDLSDGGVPEILAGAPGSDGNLGLALILALETDCDSDGNPPLGDCDDADPGSLRVPAGIGSLILSRSAGFTELDWVADSGAGSGTTYDVTGGSIIDLLLDGDFASATCLGSAVAQPPFTDPQPDPVAGDTRYYLVRAVNTCGSGGFGNGTAQPDPRAGLEDGAASAPSPDPCP
ncbi:hypothetical protein ABI59_22320 [Acidobacteria bacterium Mor1]|nr:hypothetical protein ABI59_22320 [Acidobacteria bacterium Mor1]